MTTLNTIIEEEVTKYKLLTASEVQTVWDDETGNEVFLPDFLTTAIQRAYEAGQSEERAKIREEFDEWFKRGTEDVEDWAERVLTPKSDNKYRLTPYKPTDGLEHHEGGLELRG